MKGLYTLARPLRRWAIPLAALGCVLSAARAQDNLNVFVVTVRVMDAEHKKPIAGAQIVMRAADTVSMWRQTGSTDANGWATFYLNEGGDFTLEASAPGYQPDRASFRRYGPGDGNQYRRLFELKNATAEIDRPVRLTVRVKNRLDNQPVREARVTVDPLEAGAINYSGSTDSNGVAGFEIGVSGRYRVTATQSSFLDKGNVRYTTIRKYADEKEVAVEVALYGKEDSQFVSETPPDPEGDPAAGALALTVHVVEEGTGKGLPGAMVGVKLKDGRDFSAMLTDANGDAAFTEKLSVAFAYAKPGLTIEVEKRDYDKSATEIAGNDIAAKLWHTHTVSLRMSEEGLRQRAEAESRRAMEEAQREAEAAKQKALAAEAQRRKEASDALKKLSGEIGEWANRVNGLSSARAEVLAKSDKLKGLLEEAQAALNSFQGDPALARFRAACGEALAIRLGTVEEARRAEQIERDAVRGLKAAEATAEQCRGAGDVARIRENYSAAIRALGTVGAMEKAQRQANYVEMSARVEAARGEIDAVRQGALLVAEDGQASADPAFVDGIGAIRQLGGLLANPVDPITMGTAYQGMLSTLARDYDGVLTQEQRSEIQRLSNYIPQVNPHPLSYYDVRSEGTPIQQTYSRLQNTNFELRRVASEMACKVQPADEEVARIADAVASLTIQVADDAGLANRCETRLAIAQAACDAGRLAWQEASAAGRVEDANTVLVQMKDAGCDVTGMTIRAGPASALPPGMAGTSPAAGVASGSGSQPAGGSPAGGTAATTLPPGLAGTSPAAGAASGSGSQPAGGSPADGTAATTLPPSLTGAAPPNEGGTGSSNAAGGSAPGGATTILPPSLAGSAAGRTGNGATPSSGGSPGAQLSGVPAAAGPANGLPPSVAGTGAAQPAGGPGTTPPSGNPGAGPAVQPPPSESSRTGSGGSTPVPSGGQSRTTPTQPGEGNIRHPGQGSGLPYTANECAPAGKRWPKYIFFPSLGPNNEYLAVTVTLETDYGAYADYTWGGDQPDRPKVTLQLAFERSTASMTYVGQDVRLSLTGGCQVGDAGGGRMDVLFIGSYTVFGSSKQYPFKASTMGWQ